MRAMVIERFGGPDVLHPADVPTPEPGPGEVLIRVAYAGVNPADWKCREGWLSQFFDYKFPFIVGFDAAGIVAKVGQGVDTYKVGDRVVTSSNQGLGEWGTYAEFVKSSIDRVAPLADSVDFKTAASIPTAAVTSWEAMFDTGHLKAGQKVLIHGGAGGMGSFAIQFGKHIAADVAATCGPANLDYVRDLGADRPINYRSENVLHAVRAWAPGGVDLIIDTVGQGTLPDGMEMTKHGGAICPIGTLIKDEPQFDQTEAQRRGVRIIPTMSNRQRAGAQLRTIVALFGEGRFRAPAIEVLPLEKAGDAHRRVQDGHVRGKLLLKVADL
ncbi:MAG TPA: NADP-dependent oxidoreductase [Alphaproteobacteria bacterium]|nr:NADP-dependent oxidoreductase [Alphaproteobacteria bacterium]